MQINFTLADLIGLFGVSFIVGTYFLSQVGRMRVDEPLYPALNALGAIFILVSLVHSFNMASFVIEVFWLGISLVGVVRALSARQRAKEK